MFNIRLFLRKICVFSQPKHRQARQLSAVNLLYEGLFGHSLGVKMAKKQCFFTIMTLGEWITRVRVQAPTVCPLLTSLTRVAHNNDRPTHTNKRADFWRLFFAVCNNFGARLLKFYSTHWANSNTKQKGILLARRRCLGRIIRAPELNRRGQDEWKVYCFNVFTWLRAFICHNVRLNRDI